MSNNGKTILGVVSDTHCPLSALPLKLLAAMEKVDVILHLGDFSDLKTYKEFTKIAPVIAVYGNADDKELRAQLPEKKKLEVEGFRLGLVHGWGPAKNLEKRVRKAFTDVDIILFGHSHVPLSTRIDDVMLLNPGSPSLNNDGTGTYAILELGESIRHEIIRIDT